MAIDTTKLNVMKIGPAVRPRPSGRAAIIVELRAGSSLPAYLTLRAKIAGQIHTVEIDPESWDTLESDPAVLRWSAGTRLRLIK